jgi:hypothetical protein
MIFQYFTGCMMPDAALAPLRANQNLGANRSDVVSGGILKREVNVAVCFHFCVRDEDGEIYTVRYEAVNAMLLNEFLKEHQRVEELKEIVTRREATNVAVGRGWPTGAQHARLWL